MSSDNLELELYLERIKNEIIKTMNFRTLSQSQKNSLFPLFYNIYNPIIQQYVADNVQNLPYVYSPYPDFKKEHQLKLFTIKKRGSGFLVVFARKIYPYEMAYRIIKKKKKEKEFGYFIKPYVSSYYNKKLPWQEITKEQFDLLNEIYNLTLDSFILPNTNLVNILINIKNELI